MSAIYKLSIQGIRSFDSNDRETIEFGKPLTLIVGTNGSGKTTIIECLKYATSGDLPPNSKGGAFVHDPKITGEKDVRAQVKLAFTSANNLNMIVTRNIQLLVKKTTNTFKTLEGQLVIVNGDGNRNTLSTRSLELDTQVPLYMGVPKAILEYVIFCHQEDSLWPLSEPSNLKKKFDEIFQAMKFTKALDNLKGIKKDMSLDIKLLKQSVEHLKVDRDRSKATKMNIEQLHSKIETYQRQMKEIEKELMNITQQSDKLFKSNQDFQKVLSKLENLKINRDSMREQISRLSNAIDLIDLPRVKLEELVKDFSSSLFEKEDEVKTMEEEVISMKLNAVELQGKCNILMRRQGELTAARDAHEKNKETIMELEQKFSKLYSLTLQKDGTHDVFFEDFKLYAHNMESKMNKFIEEGRGALESLSKDLSDIKHSQIVQSERLDYSKMDKQKLATEVDRLETELAISDVVKEDLEKEKENLEKFTKKLNDWEKNDTIAIINSEIKDKNDQMMIFENDLEEIQGKISKTNQQADLFAKLGFIKKSLKEKAEELNSGIESFQKDSRVIKWGLKSGPDIDIEFKKFFMNFHRDIGLKKKELYEADRNYTESLLQINNVESDLKQSENIQSSLLKKLEKSLPEDCAIEDYDEALMESEMSYRTALENLKMHQTTLEFNRKALQIAEQDSSCYLCTRKFENDEFKSEILQNLRAKTGANFENTLKETVDTEKEYLNSLRGLEKDIIAMSSAKAKIEVLQVSEKRIREESMRLKEKRDESEQDCNMLNEDRDHIEEVIRGIVELIVRSRKDIKELENESKTLSDEISLYGTSGSSPQTVDELQSAQREKNDSLRKLRKEINNLQEDRGSKSREYSGLLNLIKERNLKITEIEKDLLLKENIESDITNKNKQIKSLESSIEKLEKDLMDLSGRVSKNEEVIRSERKEFESKYDNMNTNLKILNGHLNDYVNVKQQVDTFASSESEELNNCMRELETSQQELNNLSRAIDAKSLDLVEKTRKLKDSTNEKRNLTQNLELLDLRIALNSTENDIGILDMRNAEAERDKYQQESLRLRSLFEKLTSENAGRLGEIKQLQSQIKSLSQQLLTDYKDVDNQYHKRWVELQTKTFVTDDIDTYSKALDSAIMRYHGLKMQDINRIIDELWKRTYSGTDVDKIQIRSDEVSSNVKGKSYNYRVVMYKQDAELDMRGRCSAGQKVLASIIIRLALSETFGVNCGVIALDEPTTNLDEENIESLAKALSGIIEMRRHQKNFQLIVITHDEKFLNHMNASQFTDHFFRVKRDDRQKSQIEWVDINKVTD